MASIRMSNDLRETMYREARNNFDISNKAPVFDTNTISKVTEIIQNSKMQCIMQLLYDETTNAFKHVNVTDPNVHEPKPRDIRSFGIKDTGFIKKLDLDSLHLQHSVTMTDGGKHDYTYKMLLNKTTTFYIGTESYRDTEKVVDLIELENEEREQIAPLVQNQFERLMRYKSKRDEYERSVKELLWKATTLKRVLDVWPAAEGLVPNGIIQRMHEKVTRATTAKKLQEDISFDTQLVNNVALKAKLQQGA